MVVVTTIKGESYFNQFKTPEDFTALFTPKDFQIGNRNTTGHSFRPQRGALTIARIHLYLGNTEEAKTFARYGIESVAPNTALAIEYRKIIETD